VTSPRSSTKFPIPAGGPEGLILEVKNALGDSLQVVVVNLEDIEPLHGDEVFAVRTLTKSA
jgi:hypothetical protein